MVCSVVHNALFNTLTMATPYSCVPAAFQQWEVERRSQASPLEMTPAVIVYNSAWNRSYNSYRGRSEKKLVEGATRLDKVQQLSMSIWARHATAADTAAESTVRRVMNELNNRRNRHVWPVASQLRFAGARSCALADWPRDDDGNNSTTSKGGCVFDRYCQLND